MNKKELINIIKEIFKYSFCEMKEKERNDKILKLCAKALKETKIENDRNIL